MNYKKLRAELFVALRGKTSRRSLNQLLDYSYDKIAIWEDEYSVVSWEDFVDYLDVLNVPLKYALFSNFAFFGEIRNGGDIVRFLLNELNYDDTAHLCGFPAYRLRRIATSQSPKVHEIFSMFANLHNIQQFFTFITDIGGEELPLIQNKISQSYKFYELTATSPLYTFITLLLSHSDVTSTDVDRIEFIAEQTGFDREKIQSALDCLVAIQVVNKIEGKYILNDEFTPITQTLDQNFDNSKAHLNLFSKSMEQDEQERVFHTYGSYILSKDALEQLMRATTNYYSNLDRIIKKDKGKKINLISLSMGIFDPRKYLS